MAFTTQQKHDVASTTVKNELSLWGISASSNPGNSLLSTCINFSTAYVLGTLSKLGASTSGITEASNVIAYHIIQDLITFGAAARYYQKATNGKKDSKDKIQEFFDRLKNIEKNPSLLAGVVSSTTAPYLPASLNTDYTFDNDDVDDDQLDNKANTQIMDEL